MGLVKPGDQVLISISTILKFSAQGVYLSTQPWNVLNALFDSLLIISHHTHSQKPCVHIFTQELDADVVRTGRCGPLTHLTKPTHLRISWRKRPVEDYRKPFVSADIFGFIVDLKKKNLLLLCKIFATPFHEKKWKFAKFKKIFVKVILETWSAGISVSY